MAALGATAAVAWLYALIAGLSPPVTRAAGGFTLYLVARFLFRRTRILNLLAAVTVVYLTWDPEELFEASFQLSFLAVAALGAFAVPWVEATSGPLARGMRGIANVGADPHLEPHVAQWRVEVRLAAETIALWTRLPVRWAQEILACFFRGTAFLYELVVVSVAVQTGLALAMIVYFHRLSLTAITSNLVIVPAMNVAIPAGYLAVASGWQWVGGIAHWFLWLSARTAAWHAQVEPLPRLADPPGWLSTALIAALLAGVVLGQSRLARWTVGTVLAGLLALLVWQPWPPRIEPGTLEVTAIDVGQGDSLLVVFPRGSTMLIDGGGILSFGRTRRVNFDIGEDVVSPYLWSRGIRRIDVMVATHAHQDHIGGIPALMANFHPRELWTGANPSPDLTAAARRLGVSVFERRAGPPFEYSGARVRILAPPLAYGPSKPGNGDSLALRLEYGSNSFLLTGDLERPGELDLVFDSGLGPADVLKVGHHGSRTSTNEPFLDAVSPSIAMISTGYENSFGHPHPDVLARLRARNAAILRTDLDGRVTVRSDGRRLWFDRERWREPGLATKFPVLDGLVQ
jgi:competence protein ComEC